MASCQENLELAQLQFYLIHCSEYQISGSSLTMFDDAVSMALWALICTHQRNNEEQNYHFLQRIKISKLAERFLWAEGTWTEKIKREENVLMLLCKLFGGSSLALPAEDDLMATATSQNANTLCPPTTKEPNIWSPQPGKHS